MVLSFVSTFFMCKFVYRGFARQSDNEKVVQIFVHYL